MYNMLVENCFDKCTAVGWNGVGRTTTIRLLSYLLLSVELYEQSVGKWRVQMRHELCREIFEAHATSRNEICGISESAAKVEGQRLSVRVRRHNSL